MASQRGVFLFSEMERDLGGKLRGFQEGTGVGLISDLTRVVSNR